MASGNCSPPSSFSGTWNGQPASLAWLLDITDRKRTEEALRRSEKMFAAIFQSTPAMLTLSRLDDGRFIDVNSGFLEAIGYERDAIVGRTAGEIALFVDPEAMKRACERMDRMREEMRKRVGEVEVAVSLIRESRDET